jgi:hypothetical protein
MVIIIYVTLPATCALALFLFSFWLGRCSRKLPVIDDHLPWTMSRDQAPRCTAECKATRVPPPNTPRWPESRSLKVSTTVKTNGTRLARTQYLATHRTAVTDRPPRAQAAAVVGTETPADPSYRCDVRQRTGLRVAEVPWTRRPTFGGIACRCQDDQFPRRPLSRTLRDMHGH